MTEICHSNLPCHGACCILRLGHPRCKNEPQTYLRCSAQTRFFTSSLFLKCISDDPQNCLIALVILRSTSNVPPAEQFFQNRVPQTYLRESHFWEVPFQSEIVLDWLTTNFDDLTPNLGAGPIVIGTAAAISSGTRDGVGVTPPWMPR